MNDTSKPTTIDTKDSKQEIKTSIGTQLLVVVFLVYILIAGIITMFHLLGEYKYGEKKVNDDLRAFVESFEPGIAYALWTVEGNQLQSMVNGMVKSPSIVGVKIEDCELPKLRSKYSGEILEDGNVLKYNSKGLLLSEPGITKASNLWHFSKPIYYHEEGQDPKFVGTMTIYSSSKIVMSRIRYEFIFIIIDAILKTTAIWIIFWIFCNSMLSTPLQKFIKSIQSIDYQNLEGTEFKFDQLTKSRNELTLLQNSFNTMVKNLATAFDDHKKASKEIQKLRNYLANVIDSMPSGIVGVDNYATITQWNRQAEIVTGTPHEDVLGKPVEEVLKNIPNIRSKVLQTIASSEINSISKLDLSTEEKPRFLDVTIYPLISDDGKSCDAAVIRVDDVTERVRIDEIMMRSEKMVSIGGLAAGMAHEINNPLAGISQNMQLVKSRLDPNFDKNKTVATECDLDLNKVNIYLQKRNLTDLFKNIDESTNRAVTIVKNMLSFSRKNDFANHDLAVLLEQTIDIVSSDYELKKQYDFKSIKFSRNYSSEPVIANVEPGQIQQVFFNLLKNGAQAMREITEPNYVPKFSLRVYQDHKNAIVEIENNGPHIPEKVREQIFEPFFTTKAVGVGTGLGLSVSHFIIHDVHAGIIEVANLPQTGVCFKITLPIQREK